MSSRIVAGGEREGKTADHIKRRGLGGQRSDLRRFAHGPEAIGDILRWVLADLQERGVRAEHLSAEGDLAYRGKGVPR